MDQHVALELSVDETTVSELLFPCVLASLV